MTAPHAAWVEAGVALGSNLGDRAAALRAAVSALRVLPGVEWVAQSRRYETEPEDVAPEHAALRFLNAVAIVRTDLAAADLLAALHGIERALGRRREGGQNAPRTIDLDLLYHGGTRSAAPDLVLPHPRLSRRRFVLQPLADVRPGLVLPGYGVTVAALLSACPPGGKVVPWPDEPA